MFFRTLSKLILLFVVCFSLFNIYEIRVSSRGEQTALIDDFTNNIEKNLDVKVSDTNEDGVFSVKKANLNMVGALFVPDIDLKIAVFDQAGETEISEGAGIIKGSGDLSTDTGQNTIITSHNGDSFKDLFTNLNKLKNNDKFYIKNEKGEMLEYEIFDSKVVSPIGEYEHILKPSTYEKLITLRTCTPTGVNSHRLLVTGRYVRTLEKEEIVPESNVTFSTFEYVLFIILLFSLVSLIRFIIIDHKYKKSLKEKKSSQSSLEENREESLTENTQESVKEIKGYRPKERK